jgi:magnesium transporter
MLSPQPSENAPTLEICTTAVYRGGLANLQPGVLRQLCSGAAAFEVVAPEELTRYEGAVEWVDALEVGDAELSDLGRALGYADAVVQWLHDPRRSPRPQVVDGALTLILTVPGGEEIYERQEIVVVMTGTLTFTAHDGRHRSLIDDLGRVGGAAPTPVVRLIDAILDRYEGVVDRLAEHHEAHETGALRRAGGSESPTDVVADSLRLARELTRVQRGLRRLRQTLTSLRRMGTDGEDVLDARSRALEAVESDVDGLSYRLQLATDARLSLLSARQNEISKKIGAWAGVFAVNAVITGWYGMNISPLPGAGSWVTVAIIMATATVALILLFRRVDWL